MSQIPICIFIRLATQEPSPCLRQNTISIWLLVWDAACRGHSLWVQHALISESLTNLALGRVGGKECLCVSGVSAIQASFDYSPVEESLAAFAIFWGRYQVSPLAHQMSSARNRLHPLPFVIEQQPEPSIR